MKTGWASSRIQVSTHEMAVVNGEINLGAFGTLSAELPVNTSKGCIKFSAGIRVGVELEVLKFGSRALFELNGVHSTILGESSIPASCDTSG